MRYKIGYLFSCLLICFIFLSISTLKSQDSYSGYVVISGSVKDKESKEKIPYASVFIPNTDIGTVTNDDGDFTIKIKDSIQAKEIEFYHIGYENFKLAINGKNQSKITVFLTPNSIVLKEVTIFGGKASSLVDSAIRKIKQNYSNENNLLTGFYRETVQKKRNYISVSEAIIDIYKTPYTNYGSVERDRVQITKGRKLISQKMGDTLAVKLQGGPTLCVYLDFVKSPYLLLDESFLSYYSFTAKGYILIDDRQHYQVSFSPQVILAEPLYYGKIYIDVEDFTISRVEFNLSMDDIDKATSAILYRKPYGLRFKPEEVSFLISYKRQDGRSYISYIRNEVRFKCDWKKKLFSTNYTIVSEMVTIDKIKDDITKIPNKMAFKINQTFSDKVSSFFDPNFWLDYNIIEPTESLESAVKKLRKHYKE